MNGNHKETLGPPFAPENGWTKIATTVPPEFWSATRLDSATGNMTIQLGVKPHSFTTQGYIGDLIVGFQRKFVAIADGYYTFTVRWEPGRITVRNQGATVGTYGCFLGSDIAGDFPPLVSFTPVTLGHRRYLRKDSHRLLTFGGRIVIQFTADQTATAEILARAASLEVEYPPVLAAQTLSAPLTDPSADKELPSIEFLKDFECRLIHEPVESSEQAEPLELVEHEHD